MFWSKSLAKYFSKSEIILWCSSVTLIIISFLFFDREGYLTLFASLVGVTSLLFNAKGNPVGQAFLFLENTPCERHLFSRWRFALLCHRQRLAEQSA